MKPTKNPKPKVYSVTFKVRTTATAKAVKYEADLFAGDVVSCLIIDCDDATLVMKPRVEEVGTR